MLKVIPILFVCLTLPLLLAACAAPVTATPTPSPLIATIEVVYSSRDFTGPGPRPPTVMPPTVVYQPEAACQVSVELTQQEFVSPVHSDFWIVIFHYTFRVDPDCYAPVCSCSPEANFREIHGEGRGYEIYLPGSLEDGAGKVACPFRCDEHGQVVIPISLQTRGLYAVYLGEQLLGYLDVPEGVSSSSGPPPEVTRPTGAPTSTLPPYPSPSPPRYVTSTPNPLWTLTPTVNPADYPPPPPGFGPYP